MIVAALALAGCGAIEEEPVRDAARQFHAALAEHRWGDACARLATSTRTQLESDSGTSCEHALAEEQVPTPQDDGRLDVFGTSAQLRYRTESLFLTRAGDGWQVRAAGCDPTGPRPYECRLEAG